MKAAVLVFPGINRERDMARTLRLISGREPAIVWHADTELPAGTDLVVIPGGFSYGDYLRCGAIAARSPIMKGTPQFPMCGFSGQVVQILDHLGVAYKGINVLESDEIRNAIKTYSNWPTIPQLYVKGEFLGGCDIVREMFQAGELQQALKEKGVSVRQTA